MLRRASLLPVQSLRIKLLALLLAALAAVCGQAQLNPDYTTPIAPFRIADNLFYVGTRDLASYLITTPAGNILINANLQSSPPLIRASIQQLGFRYQDTRILLNGQAHFDHVAGAAAILRETRARNFVMRGDDDVMATGGHADFAFGDDITTSFPPARVDRVLTDGATIALGDPAHGGVLITAHKTAGHTRGCTTFTLQVHVSGDPATTRRSVVIVGGVAPLDHYRLVATPTRGESYPGIAADFEHTFATLRALPCDIFLGAHGVYFGMLAKLARLPQVGPQVFIDPAGYQAFVAQGQASSAAALARQQKASR